MKSFLEWFKSSTKIKRWIFLIIIGILLTCYGFTKILVAEEITFLDLGKIITLFVIGFILVIVSIIFMQKRTLEILIEANNNYTKNGKKTKVNIKSLIFNKKIYEEGPKIVVIGGGQGLNTVIKGLKKYTNNITAIVTMADYEKENTESESSLNYLPLKDIKDCIVAMSDKENIMEQLINLKFKDEKLKYLNFGDVYISAMSQIYSNVSEAIQKSTEVLNITGRVIPVTLDEINICAELSNGTTITQKDNISEIVSERIEKINRVYISPSNCKPSTGVIEAIGEAEAIIVGPGSLYTNVLPNLLIRNVSKAIKDSKAIKLYISNIMTEPGQTDNFSLSDHLRVLQEHIGQDVFSYCLADTGEITPEYVRKYNKEGSDIVEIDVDKSSSYGMKILQKRMSCIKDDKIRHNPDIIASVIIELICNDLKFKDEQNDIEYLLLNSVLKEQKKLQAKQEKINKDHKGVVKKATKKVVGNEKRISKFKEKYKERVESIQNTESRIEQNRKIAEEIERLEKKKNKGKNKNTNNLDNTIAEEIEKLNSSREVTKEKIKNKKDKKK